MPKDSLTQETHDTLRLRIARLMGWELRPVGPDYDGQNAGEVWTPPGIGERDFENCLPRKGAIAKTYFCKRWTTEYEDAQWLLEEMRNGGLQVTFRFSDHGVGVIVEESVTAVVGVVYRLPIYAGTHETFALAISNSWIAWREHLKQRISHA